MRRIGWPRLALIVSALGVVLVAIAISVGSPFGSGHDAQKLREAEHWIGSYVGYDVSCTRLGAKDGLDVWRCRGGGKDECWATSDPISGVSDRHRSEPDETLPGCPKWQLKWPVVAQELNLQQPPEAGQTLVATMPFSVGDAPAVSAEIACTAMVAGRALPATNRSYRAGAARCVWHLPVTSGGGVIRGNIRAATSAGSVSRSFRARIAAAGPRVEITSFRDKSISYPGGITAGPDGALWFTSGDSIGRITTSGKVSIFRDQSISYPGGITAGPDGALWFTNGDSIGRITTRGGVTAYRSKSIRYLGDSITAGPDGALWFTMYSEEAMYSGQANASGVGRITTTGRVTIHRDPAIDGPGGITAGPDGALWFTMFNYKRPYAGVGRITTQGGVTATSLDSGEADGIGPSLGITVGPDRAVWFTHPRLDFESIGRITTDGKVRIFRDVRMDSPNEITVGPDRALWFTNEGGNSIGRITTSGTVSIHRHKSIRSPQGITLGRDGALWFTNDKSIGRLRMLPTR